MRSTRVQLNLIAAKPIRAMVQSSLFPVVLQVGAFVVLALLVFYGFGHGSGMSSEELMTFRKTNITTLVIWGLWWPAMIAVALAFGRAWCTVCPMEMVNRVGDSIARMVGWPRAKLGKLLRAGWMTVVLYLVMQLLVAGYSIHRVPHYTALTLLALFGVALLTGLVFRQPRSFCKAFCPVGALLSVYGRYTPLQLEARDPSVCERCPTKDCIKKRNRYYFDKRSCPSLLRPFHRDPSDGCVLCLQCVKVCPYDNMGVGFVSPDAPIRRKELLKPYEAAFVMVALGFVAHEVTGEVKWLDSVFHFVPEQLGALAPRIPFGWFEAFWFLVLFPLAVWAAIAGATYLAGHRSGLRSLLLAVATGAAPVVAIAHLAKAVAKVSSWGGFLPFSLRDPRGLDTYHQLADGSLSAPTALIGLSITGWVMLALVAVITWRAIAWSRQVPAESTMAVRIGLAGAAALFTSILTVWTLPSL